MNELEVHGRARDVKDYIAREDQESGGVSTWSLVAINCRNNKARCTKGVVIDVGQTI